MLRTRVIPCLLLQNKGLVKTEKFKNPKYVGDPINAIRIFNEKEVDELIFLDIEASKNNKSINYNLVQEIASECFMPFCYGGGIRNSEQIRNILNLGVEKVAINTEAVSNISFIKEASKKFGSSTIVVSLDIKKNLFGKYQVYIKGGTINTKLDPVAFSKTVEEAGAGELLINSIDRDGTMQGYDIELIKKITLNVNIPVIASGGAGKLHDFVQASAEGGASAVAAGSMFVFHGKHKAVLITYPKHAELSAIGL